MNSIDQFEAENRNACRKVFSIVPWVSIDRLSFFSFFENRGNFHPLPHSSFPLLMSTKQPRWYCIAAFTRFRGVQASCVHTRDRWYSLQTENSARPKFIMNRMMKENALIEGRRYRDECAEWNFDGITRVDEGVEYSGIFLGSRIDNSRAECCRVEDILETEYFGTF